MVSQQVQPKGMPPTSASVWARATDCWWIVIITVFVAASIGCDASSASKRLLQARELSADLLVQFTKAADAASRAVMADTDEASVAFAQEAEKAKQAVQRDTEALAPVLQGLGYSEETRLLEDFGKLFSEYRALDRTILDLAVENTNLKAQRLSLGPAQEAADSIMEAVDGVVPADATRDSWRVKALAATALAAVREIQVLQAPHIANADDAVMTRIEERMAASERAARSALEKLVPLAQPASKARLATAAAALDRFMGLNAQIVALSRRNTNVRSLALSLNEKGKLAGTCEDALHALRDALAGRGFTGTR
jgi:hypothetical protein